MRSGKNVLLAAVPLVTLFMPVGLAAYRAREPSAAPPDPAAPTDIQPLWLEGATFTETFTDISVLEAAGWVFANRSEPVGTEGWFQGNAAVFAAHEGAATAYLAANFNSAVDVPGTINNWAFLPVWSLRNGDEFSFYTRTIDPVSFPDRLEVRLSTKGASTYTGAGTGETGDFTTLLLSINPELTNEYPTEWTEYRLLLSGLPSPGTTNGRLAFRYHVPGGGPSGANSNYIGIDSVSYFSYQPDINVQSTVGLTAMCEAGSELELDTSQSY